MIAENELLRRYVEDRSEEAFAQFVERHLKLVYFAALRRTAGNAALAQDVAQAVFTAAAREAKALTRHAAVTGWLYTTTRNIAAKTMRAEEARRRHERQGDFMSENATEPRALDREQLRPVLDETLEALPSRDREAVLLRFFEERAFAEVGAALKISEDAARMRVDRALEKLRQLLARRGITSTAAALGAMLASEGAGAVPAGLAASVSGASLAGAATVGATSGVLLFMTANKTSAAALAAVAGVVGLNLVQQQANARLQDEFASLAAQYHQVEPLRVENRRLAAEAVALASRPGDTAELTRLRARANELRNRFMANQPILWVGNRPITRSMPPEEKLEVMFREGRSSPMLAWQTLLATGRGHHAFSREEMLDLHALMFCLDDAAREKVEAFLAALPAGTSGKLQTPERLLAPVFDQWRSPGGPPLRYGGGPAGDVFIDGDPNRAYSRWRVKDASGVTREEHYPFQRFNEGWRYGPLTESDVEQMLALLDPATGRPKAASDPTPPPAR